MQTGELERPVAEEAPPPPPHASMTVTGDSAQPGSVVLLLPPPLAATSPDFKFKNEPEPATSDVEEEEEAEDVHHRLDLPPFQGDLLHPKLHDQNANESVRSWLQRITAMQHDLQRKHKPAHKPAHSTTTTTTQCCTTSTEYQHVRSSAAAMFAAAPLPPPPPPPPSRVVKYQDLPYMGEMTLDNSKPRRGRKPKKADICHLIYKNYGTIFPGTPRSLVGTDVKRTASKLTKDVAAAPPAQPPAPLHAEPNQKTNVQNRIISSLLEKRLTQESLRNKEQLLLAASRLPGTKPAPAAAAAAADQDEPLNLCIRDLNQLKIRLLRKHGNVYTSDSALNEVKSEPLSDGGGDDDDDNNDNDDDDDDDVEFVNESPSAESVVVQAAVSSPSPCLDATSPDLATAPGGYVYWPNAGVFIHPAALHSHLMYYQKMAAHSSYTVPSPALRPQAATPPTPPRISPTVAGRDKEPRKSGPRQAARPAAQHDRLTASDDMVDSAAALKRVAATAAAAATTTAPTKRKRSAIFIPPIPAENQTNPATEVSICKFKFTGGAKPSLQEKKMLSVDSGGNFRYYSGTGDKSMRGYEFFPRETLQQQAAAGSSHGSGTGAFLQASGEKMPMMMPPPPPPPAPPPAQTGNPKPGQEFVFAPEQQQQEGGAGASTTRHRKRKTRKSLQREKLEQTFKEKGFLIQTQQLESAEGATYCKFRQLRKFTRYLFRSWKDYLPGSVRELQEVEKSDEDETDDAQVLESRIHATSSTSDLSTL